jgi:pullulanase/glycogen debranching enzyme
MLTTLLLSFGVPMLLGGDELGRTQAGNNNAYCQDNEISWFDWSAADSDLLSFSTNLVAFRRSHPVFRRRRFLSGIGVAELGWFTPAGTPMTQADWSDRNALALGVYLDGSDDPDTGPDGQPMLDDNFLVLVNAWWEPLGFSRGAGRARVGRRWRRDHHHHDGGHEDQQAGHSGEPCRPGAPPAYDGRHVRYPASPIAALRVFNAMNWPVKVRRCDPPDVIGGFPPVPARRSRHRGPLPSYRSGSGPR